MKIIVDIAHPAHVNFFKHALRALARDGHQVVIAGLRRGELPKILENELAEFPVHYVGNHRGTKFSIIVEANLLKFFRLFFLVLSERPDFGLSVGSFTLGAVLKLFGKPNVQFDDDPERPVNVFLEKLTSTRLFFPPIVAPQPNVGTMNALKEWAYLSPRYFTANADGLSFYNLVPKHYIFVREVSTGSLNYADQEANTIASFAAQLPEQYPVLLSLEDKQTMGAYPAHWTVLQEPVPDIHSLLYYSCLVISSGDSMAREGAMLGVPSVYVGSRDMKANAMMQEKKMLFQCSVSQAPDLVDRILEKELTVPTQDEFRAQLRAEWDDITQLIVSQIDQDNDQIAISFR
jgi:predicted glycosyltransferase